MEMEVKIIESLDEIKTVGIYAKTGHESKWIQIDFEDNEYSVYGMVSGSMPTSILKNSQYVKTWKTLSGVVKSLKTYSQKGKWGLSYWTIKN